MANKNKNSDSQYKGVCRFRKNDIEKLKPLMIYKRFLFYANAWSVRFSKYNVKRLSAVFKTEREAAKAVDLFYIRNGVEPVNILKRVS